MDLPGADPQRAVRRLLGLKKASTFDGLADRLQRGLLPFNRKRDVLILLGYAVLENFFWRPLTLYWRLRGLWDAWRGKSGWEKFARQGFQKHPEAQRAA